MPNKTLKIIAYMPAVPGWLKINNTITVPLPLKSAKELANKLLEVQEDAEIVINFVTGKEAGLEIKFESKTEEYANSVPDKI